MSIFIYIYKNILHAKWWVFIYTYIFVSIFIIHWFWFIHIPHTHAITFALIQSKTIEASGAKVFQSFSESENGYISFFVCPPPSNTFLGTHFRVDGWEADMKMNVQKRVDGGHTNMEMFHFYSHANSELFSPSAPQFYNVNDIFCSEKRSQCFLCSLW